MRILLDENMSSRRLARRLQSAGHDVAFASDVGLLSGSDARVLTWAVAHNRSVLTRDYDDFAALHDLVVAVGGHHPGTGILRTIGDEVCPGLLKSADAGRSSASVDRASDDRHRKVRLR
jgi:predicted nuclease of predicted toxin-antitoxin system